MSENLLQEKLVPEWLKQPQKVSVKWLIEKLAGEVSFSVIWLTEFDMETTVGWRLISIQKALSTIAEHVSINITIDINTQTIVVTKNYDE